jgi:AcrR family transcriptional regulator
MRSVRTTRDQLLSIATEMFAENGFAGTSLRSIAKQAEVSPALLVHHFGTKDALVKEAISKTLGDWVADEKAAMLDDESHQVENWQSLAAKGATSLNFFKQALLAGGEYSQRLFNAAFLESEALLDEMQELGRLKDISDKQTIALMMTISGLGSVLFMSQIEHTLGGPISSDHVASRLVNANHEMMQDGVFLPATATIKKSGR